MDDTKTAVVKGTTIAALAGISHMSILEWAQFAAALIAVVYGGLQIYVLVRDKIRRSNANN
jgi:hypothetical protein